MRLSYSGTRGYVILCNFVHTHTYIIIYSPFGKMTIPFIITSLLLTKNVNLLKFVMILRKQIFKNFYPKMHFFSLCSCRIRIGYFHLKTDNDMIQRIRSLSKNTHTHCNIVVSVVTLSAFSCLYQHNRNNNWKSGWRLCRL